VCLTKDLIKRQRPPVITPFDVLSEALSEPLAELDRVLEERWRLAREVREACAKAMHETEWQ
jgi:hypothetical protein